MESGSVSDLGAVAGGVGAALVLLSTRRAVLVAGFALLAFAEAALVLTLVRDSDVSPPGSLVAALVLAGIPVLAACAWLLVRYPAATPVAVLVVAPFRVPIELGTEDAFLLVPLYLVLAAACLALLVRGLRGETLPRLPLLLAAPGAAFVVLAALSIFWTNDDTSSAIQLAFFIFPFAALAAVVARAPFRDWTAPVLAGVLVASACVFTLVGLWQVRTGNLFFAPDQEVFNEYTSYERVTSMFKDPSIYGRHLAVTIVVLVVALLLGRLHVLAAAALIAFVWTGLFFSYSQSSMIALFVAVLAVTLVAAPRRTRRVVLVTAVAAGLITATAVVALAQDESVRRVTSGRSDLVRSTAGVIVDNLPLGVGIGSEREATRERARERDEGLRRSSHTTPLTVAAELGVPGVLVYLALLLSGAALLVEAYRRRPPVGLALIGVLVVVFVHSLFYSGFFEDPLVWGALAVAAAAVSSAAYAHRPGEAGGKERTPRPLGEQQAEPA